MVPVEVHLQRKRWRLRSDEVHVPQNELTEPSDRRRRIAQPVRTPRVLYVLGHRFATVEAINQYVLHVDYSADGCTLCTSNGSDSRLLPLGCRTLVCHQDHACSPIMSGPRKPPVVRFWTYGARARSCMSNRRTFSDRPSGLVSRYPVREGALGRIRPLQK